MSIDLTAPSVRQHLIESEFERLRRIQRAWEHYLGQNQLPLPISREGIDDNVRVNLGETLVSKGVSWLFGADRALGFTVEDDEGAGDKLDEAWPVERRALALHQLGTNGGVAGHTFCRLREDGRLIVWDPSNVQVDWDDEDVEDVFEFRNTWTSPGDSSNVDPQARRQRVIRGDSGTSWLVIDEISKASGDSWEEIGRETWAREWAPVFHCQNLPMPNEFWGRADLELDVLDLIEGIQAVAGYSRKLVRHKGHPLPYATGESAKNIAEIDVSLGRFLAIPNAQAKVGQLEASDLGGAMTLYEKLWEAWHFVTRCPPIAFGVGVTLANVKLETVEQAWAPAVEKTWDKRLTYGPMLIELAGRMLELAGTKDKRPSPDWGPIIPPSAKAEAEALEADRRMGIVSRKTVSGRRGYDWDVEEPLLAEERQQSMEQMQQAFDRGEVEDEDE